MTKENRFSKGLALAVVVLMAGVTPALADINVLWYTGGVGDSAGGPAGYNADVAALAALAPGAPGGNTWNVTLWSGGAMPAGGFNVLVVASPEGGWNPGPDYLALNAAALSFDPTAQRVMLTGQDADWHYMNEPGGAPDSVNPAHGFDGPEGFLLDSINWAGSGTGMGLVALGQDGTGICAGGASFSTGGGFSPVECETDNVVIPGGVALNPVNTNLTSAGLSNWFESAHDEFTGLSSVWQGINIDGNFTGGESGDDRSCATSTPDGNCVYVTIVSANAVGGGIGGGSVPEPSSIMLFGTAMLLVGGGLRRLKRS